MQSWLAKRVMTRNLRALNAGNPKPTLRMDARDVELTFPGENSFSGMHRGKREVAAWLERFCITGLHIAADEVIVKGLPWRTTICVRGTDHLDTPDGERVYENRYVIWGHLRWGRLKRYEVYEDTEKATALDRWLEQTGHPGAASAWSAGRRRRLRRAA
jgi:ketosteroid isomerase-like protein